MHVLRVDNKEYYTHVKNVLTVFDSAPFINFNEKKCNEIHYLLFKDKYFRCGIILGEVRKGVLRSPFSAPYGLFSDIRNNNSLDVQYQVVEALLWYVKTAGLEKIIFTLPPQCYDYTSISSWVNVLFVNKFHLDDIDINYHFSLDNFTSDYLDTCNIKFRQKLKTAIKDGLVFEEVVEKEPIKEAYDVIKKNRQFKGYPLKMDFEQIYGTLKVFDSNVFIVRNSRGEVIASAIVFVVSEFFAQVIYWGNDPDFDNNKCMNFLSYMCLNYYKRNGFKALDIGPSSSSSEPNFGLCNFKKSMGCDVSLKYTFSMVIP